MTTLCKTFASAYTLFFCLAMGTLQAQEPAQIQDQVRYIEDMYQYVALKIKAQDYPHYTHLAQDKTQRLSLPSLEGYQGQELYFYSLNGNSEPVLRMVKVAAQHKKEQLEQAYLYDLDGNLMLHESTQAQRRYKAYFAQDTYRLLQWHENGRILGSVVMDDSQLVDSIRQEARSYHRQFQHYMRTGASDTHYAESGE
ncbi:hypothetical protein [Eisenibacter elegans]|uniref:hypothetical protein n=1 Tax=Eisenibacter elegans TaxID=997 RepID=UPI00042881D3|nr:hypothetical protein [Eisenibacter elegans]